MLDGCIFVPVIQGPLAYGCDHPVGPGIEEIFPYGGPFSLAFLGTILPMSEIECPVRFPGYGQEILLRRPEQPLSVSEGQGKRLYKGNNIYYNEIPDWRSHRKAPQRSNKG